MPKSPPSVYQLKIVLNNTKPPIWRRIVVPANIPFFDLHVYIQDAMGWEDCHLHHFFIGEPSLQSTRICLAVDEPLRDNELDERDVQLPRYLTRAEDWVTYEYDFGDSWWHQVTVEKILPADPSLSYPICTGGKRACPPEDVGGAWGYERLLEILDDPDHEEHQDKLDWLGLNDPEEFEPEFWSPEDVTFSDPKQVLKEYEEAGY